MGAANEVALAQEQARPHANQHVEVIELQRVDMGTLESLGHASQSSSSKATARVLVPLDTISLPTKDSAKVKVYKLSKVSKQKVAAASAKDRERRILRALGRTDKDWIFIPRSPSLEDYIFRHDLYHRRYRRDWAYPASLF